MIIDVHSSELNNFIAKSKVVASDLVFIIADTQVEFVKSEIGDSGHIESLIETKAKDAEVLEKGIVALPKKIFDLIKDNEWITITDDYVKCKTRVIKLQSKGTKDVNRIEDDFKYKIFKLNDKSIKELLEVKHAVSKDLTKPQLCTIKIEDNTFEAVDGYKFSRRTGDFTSDTPVLIKNYKLLESLKGDIDAFAGDNYIKYVVNGDYTCYSRLQEGDYIDTKKLTPREFNTEIIVVAKNILESLKTLDKVSSGNKNNLLKLDLSDKTINLTVENDDMIVNDEVELCDSRGDFFQTTGVNCKYMLESMKALNAKNETVNISFTTNVNPIIITYKNKYELILPVRISNINAR